MLRLELGDSSVVVAPETGGAVLGWLYRGTPVLRRATPEAVLDGNVRMFGAFPLLPFCNRIAHGRFTWEGRSYQLDRNFGDHPHSIHGVGWQQQWEVAATADASVSLMLDYAGDARHWPFSFRAGLEYRLSEHGCQVTFYLTNCHSDPAPAGIGLHPYFPRAAGQTLRFDAGGVWLNDADSLPLQHNAVPADWEHRAPRPVGSVVLDNCFTGWSRRARIAGVAGGLTIEADAAFRHLQVFTPAGKDFFCVEAVSHVADALNRKELAADQAMHVLQPGETLSGSITFTLA
jgi:aldose 1-epimerase